MSSKIIENIAIAIIIRTASTTHRIVTAILQSGHRASPKIIIIRNLELSSKYFHYFVNHVSILWFIDFYEPLLNLIVLIFVRKYIQI